MSGSDLTFVPLEVLADEICRRTTACVMIFSRPDEGFGSRDLQMVTQRFTGNYITQVGLMQVLNAIMNQQLHANVQAFFRQQPPQEPL